MRRTRISSRSPSRASTRGPICGRRNRRARRPEESAGAASATLATSVKNGAAIGNWTLPATGGYGALSVKETFGNKRGPVTAALAFDGTTFWMAELIAKGLGFSVIFR